MDPDSLNPNSVIAAVGGSITGLALMPWETMTWPKRLLTLFTGFACAVFVAPWLVDKIYGPTASTQAILMISYVTGAGAHILLPRMIKLISRIVGDKL